MNRIAITPARSATAIGLAVMAAGTATAGEDAWITFANETASRLVADPALGLEDPDEKSYVWGDLDHDGDLDLVVARK